MIVSLIIIDVAYHIWTNITVEPGDLRSCANLSIPDNLCLDKDKEYQIYFTVLSPPENTTIKFQRNTSWLFIVDNDSKGFAISNTGSNSSNNHNFFYSFTDWISAGCLRSV